MPVILRRHHALFLTNLTVLPMKIAGLLSADFTFTTLLFNSPVLIG
jgi:hypothetical protein